MAARVAELERTVRALAAGGNGGGQRRGASRWEGRGQQGEHGGAGGDEGTSARAANGNSSRGRPGDWACPSCAFFPCFARAARCIKCRTPRHGGRGGGAAGGAASTAVPATSGRLTSRRDEDMFLGPVGAGGSRPMLGRRGQQAGQARDDCPSVRVPGASTAARVEEERRRKQEADSEGFQPVRHGPAAAAGTGAAAAIRAGVGQRQGQPTPTRNSWAALSEEEGLEGDDGGGQDERVQRDDYGGEMAEDVEQATPPPQPAARGEGRADADDEDGGVDQGRTDAAQLRREWQALGNAVRVLDAQGAPRSLLAEARAQRDAAEARWRAAKIPQPLFKRLKWAEAELKEAETKERQARSELQSHVEEAAKKTKELQGRLDIAAARSERKRTAIAALHAEGVPQPQRHWTAGQAATAAATGIAQDVAPTLASVIARMSSPMGDDVGAIKRELEICAQQVGYVEEMLREAATGADTSGGGGPARFDISGGDAEGGGPRDEGGGADAMEVEGGGGGGGPPPAAAAVPRWTKPAPNLPWKRQVLSSTSSAAASATPATAGPAAAASSVQAVEEARRKLLAHATMPPTPLHQTTSSTINNGDGDGGGNSGCGPEGSGGGHGRGGHE